MKPLGWFLAFYLATVGVAHAQAPVPSITPGYPTEGPIAKYLFDGRAAVTVTSHLVFPQVGQRRSRNAWFPVKVGALVGCGAGAILGFTLSPHYGDTRPFGPAERAKATLGMCAVVGAFGAVVGYVIATR